MDKKKILIIAQAIYPAQFPRSQRATELAKELARQGHEVILYAVLGKYAYSDFEKENNIKVKNIGKMKFATLNSDGEGRRNLLDKIFHKLLKRLFEFPDIELMFKISDILKNETDVDLLISVAMPFPIHWGCAFAKSKTLKQFPKIWAADCGDPYMGNRVEKLKPFFYFKYIEKWFCNKTDYIVVPIQNAIDGYYPEFHNKIRIIPQGFRFNLIDEVKDLNPSIKYAIPTFAYAGLFYKGFRDPTNFLNFLTTYNKPFKFIVYTSNKSLIEPFVEKLQGRIEVYPYIPRDELLLKLSEMDFLVNFENGTTIQSPSKLIDYSLTKRPIISIDSTFYNKEPFLSFMEGDYSNRLIIENIDQYNISNVASNFIDLIN